MFFVLFPGIMPQFELSKYALHLCSFQILNGVKQCTTYQRTNYHVTTHHSRYLSQLELLQSRDIRTANLFVTKILTFDPRIINSLNNHKLRPRSVVASMLNCGYQVIEFKLQLYHSHDMAMCETYIKYP